MEAFKVRNWMKRVFNLDLARDNNYYWGLLLLQLAILSLIVYLIFDAYEPLAFLVTFLICAWGFVLLWKSDNDLRFKMAQMKIEQLEIQLEHSRMFIVPAHLLKRKRVNS